MRTLKPTILYLATYPPRECGIATFTQDLVTAIDKQFNPAVQSRVVGINENITSIYQYSPKVLNTICADSIKDYVAMAEEINNNDEVRLVSIQHEFGLFGGRWGDYLVPFLQSLKKPVVITFHSVLPHPDDYLRNLVKLICQKSQAVVVMNEHSRDILIKEYGAEPSCTNVIPHGIPSVTFETSVPAKTALGLQDKIILLTFGLLSPTKGVEYAIRALPPIVKKYPNLLYIVVGATHPNIRRAEGERYRNFLQKEVERLNLQKNVKFYNKYLSLEDIISYLKATDIYISTALGREQSVSGTLSYALGCGRPVVSTATSYARYLIGRNCGTLVGFKDATGTSRAIKKIIEDKQLLKNMSTNAYEATRKMTWPNVARAYFDIFQKIADIGKEEKKLPAIKLEHLIKLTDNFGIIHHARYSKPQRRFGYALDDNARALIVVSKYYQINQQPELVGLMETYLNFMSFCQRKNGLFARTVTARQERDWEREDDVLGRAIWALGFFLAADIPYPRPRSLAEDMFKKSIRQLAKIRSPRAIAFTLTGLHYFLKSHPDKKLFNLAKQLADRQVTLYGGFASTDWQWFEDRLTYSNSKIPESLYRAYDLTGKKKYLDVAEKTLKFLCRITFEPKHYSAIGQAGWFVRGGKRSYFDQQPEDVASMVETKVIAYKITRNKKHLKDAYDAFYWFLGRNHLKLAVYDEASGGCNDGLGQHALNLNQGAESTISYLLARLAIEQAL